MLAETHQDRQKTLAMNAELGKLGWQATSSPAMESDKSIFGNIAGVTVAIKKFIDNRPSSDCIDVKGSLSENPFVTARTVVMQGHEIQSLAAYLECGGFKGRNLSTMEEIDKRTRGGEGHFLLRS